MFGWICPEILRAAVLVLPLFLAPPALGADQKDLATRRDNKQDSDFFYQAAWEVDYLHAKARAKHWKVPLFAYFTRSYDGSEACTTIENNVLVGAEFAKFGKTLSLYCNITSRVDGDPNQGLLFEKNGSNWPYIAVLDGEGRLLAAHEGENSIEGFQATIEKAKKVAAELEALAERSKKGDVEATAALLEARLELRHLSSKTGRKRLAMLSEFDEKRKARLDALVERAAYSEIFSAYMKKDYTASQAVARYERLHERGTTPDLAQAVTFWQLLTEDALAHKESDIVKLAFEHMTSLELDDVELRSRVKATIESIRKHFHGEH